MATYYVDFVGGDDTNNGTSTSTPFKRCPGDDNATGVAGSTTLSAGDICVFKGGVSYNGRVDADWDGSAVDYIYYESGEVSPWSWGTGRAIMDGSGISFTGGRLGIISIPGSEYIYVRGQKFQDAPWSPQSGGVAWAYQIAKGGGVKNVVIDNIEAVYNTDGIVLQGIWTTAGDDPSGFVIKNCDLHGNRGHGFIFQRGIKDIDVYDTDSYNNGYEGGDYRGDNFFTAQGAYLTDPTNVHIYDCNFYDGVYKGQAVLNGCHGLLVERCKFWENDNHVRFGFSTGHGHDITVRNCLFIDTDETNELEGLIRVALENYVDGLYIYNNTFIGTSMTAAIHLQGSAPSWDLDNVEIYNNVFNNGGEDYYIRCTNNPIVNFKCNNNHYYNGGGNKFYWDGASRTFAQWKTVTGEDGDSVEGTDPGLNAAYKPSSGSSAVVDTGTDLSGEGFSNDFDGNARGMGSGWDKGAFEWREQVLAITSTGTVVLDATELDVTTQALPATCTATAVLNAMLIAGQSLDAACTATVLLVRYPKKTLASIVTGAAGLLKDYIGGGPEEPPIGPIKQIIRSLIKNLLRDLIK